MKDKFFSTKSPIKIEDVNVDNIVISKLLETKDNSKYLIGYFHEAIIPLVLILPKMSAFVKTFKYKGVDKNKNNKLMSLHIDANKLLEKNKTICNKIDDLKKIELNALAVHDDRNIKTKIRIYGSKVYTNFQGLDVPEDGVECKSFTVISNDSLLVYDSKYSLQVYFHNCTLKL